MARGKRLLVIGFIDADDRVRAMQVDGMERRVTYYADMITKAELAHGAIDQIVAEGLNCSVASQLLSNYTFQKATFINAWKPSMKLQLVNSCFSSASAKCDSLTHYIGLGGSEGVEDFFTNIETGVDRIYGNYTINTWRQIFDYDMTENLKQVTCPIQWTYTTNSGLMEKEKANASQNISLYSLKEFKKIKDLLNN